MFSRASQRTFVDAVTKSFGLVALMFSAMVFIHVLNGIYSYIARIANEQWDAVIYQQVTFFIPFRTLKKVLQLFLGLCISLGLMTYFNIQGKSLRLPRVMFLSLFIIIVSYLYGRYTRVRAAFWMVLIGMMSHVGILLAICSTTEMVLDASHGVTINLIEMSLQVHCVSQIHVDMFRESLLAYLNPVLKRDSDYADV